MIYNNIGELIGNTPIIKLNSLSKISKANILGKCEFMNPIGSVKDRISLFMIENALKDNKINKNSILIEATSGNTGISLASICASKGIKLILTMPESMSIERRKILKLLGAEIILTPAKDGMSGAINKAIELQKKYNGFMLKQFENINNPKAHRETTALEILSDMDNKLDYFVSGVGTGGTITGVSEVLRKNIPNIKIIAVEPKNSPVLSGEKAGAHKIQGIGAGFIPKILNMNSYDEIIKIKDEEAIKMADKLAKDEGLLVGISSGANILASFKIASKIENKGKTILTILCDGAERYLQD